MRWLASSNLPTISFRLPLTKSNSYLSHKLIATIILASLPFICNVFKFIFIYESVFYLLSNYSHIKN